MKKAMMKVLVLVFWFAGSAVLAGTPVKLLPSVPGDVVGSELKRDAALFKGIATSPEPVSVDWALPKDTPLALGSAAHVGSGSGYWLRVSAADFNDGIILDLTQDGALVRISPEAGSGPNAAIPPADVVLVGEAGRAFSQESGIVPLLTGEQREAAANQPFPAGTSAFRIDPAVGIGEVILYADGLAYDAKTSYVVHVHEPDSPLALRVQCDRDSYLDGETLRVSVSLTDSGKPVSITDIQGRLISPSGRGFALRFNGATATHRLRALAGEPQGLWQVEVGSRATVRGLPVRRNARTAFALAVPTARFAGSVDVGDTDDAIEGSVALEVGTAGRYEIRGVLMATDARGGLVPVAVSHSAQQLPAGKTSLTLTFGKEHLAGKELGAPFAVRDLRLIHQDQLGLVQRLVNGFQFDLD